jgi:predicted nucleotidyltransferase
LNNILNFPAWISENEERTDFYKNELNPSFWKEGSFDPEVRKKLLKIASDFYEALKIPAPIKDIQLTGSLANYNWTDKSDLDVHVLIEFSDIDENTDLVKKALDGARFMWNLRHKVKIKGYEVELYIQDINEPHTASGLFSLQNNEWIRVPKYNPPEIDYKDVDKKFQGYVSEIHEMENLLATSNFSSVSPEEIYQHSVKLKKKILEMRKEGLSKSGEFSVENLTFKKLRNEGYIEKIIELISKAYTNMYNE